MKVCIRCREPKDLNDFYNNCKTKDGKYAYCKVCSKRKVRLFYSRNSDEYKQRQKDKIQAYRCLRLYGITPEQYENLLSDQSNRCKICNEHESRTKTKSDLTPRRLAVDHCHTTGKVRGLLCFRCNVLIGAVKENVALLQQIINYLN